MVRATGEDLPLLFAQYAGRFHLLPNVRCLVISHGVIHFSVPESAAQNMSAQEAAEEVDVDELKRIAKEAAEKAKDEEGGEELRTQGLTTWLSPLDELEDLANYLQLLSKIAKWT